MAAVSHPGSLRSASFASCVSSALVLPTVVITAPVKGMRGQMTRDWH
jgi:hypothetical protein